MTKAAKILIVDDEPAIVLALRHLTTREGYSVQTAANGKEALEKIRSFHPDLVLLDVMMPEMDGFEVARHIRKQESLSNISIIFLTAKGRMEDRKDGYAFGAESYIVKPFDNTDLLDTIKETLMIT